jgi:hypothetical protein
MTKLNIGDVIEIRTTKGFAYAQYTHKHKLFGALIRVYGRIHKEKLADVRELSKERSAFSCFFPLGAAVNRRIVSIVANAMVPDELQSFPVFRAGMVNPKTRRVDVWWLWDGDNEWKVGDLNAEQRKLSIRGIWNDTLLMERIESGWRPEIDSM